MWNNSKQIIGETMREGNCQKCNQFKAIHKYSLFFHGVCRECIDSLESNN